MCKRVHCVCSKRPTSREKFGGVGKAELEKEERARMSLRAGARADKSVPGRSPTVRPVKEEPGVFAGYIGDGVDRSSQYPHGRYTISNKLGSGTYGKVLGCVDKKYNLPVAIKIVRKDPPIYKEAAKKEIAVLRHLGGTHGCLRLLRDFEHDGHLCISMEMYGENLQAFMKRKGRPCDIAAVADIGLQLVHACEYMHTKQIIHTDIKCENILLAAGPEGSYTIKLVDMGSAIFTSWWHPPIIGTMEYRAPETLLQAGWSSPVDNFACGAVLVELTTGEYLLPGLREEEHLKAIETAMEQRIPQNLLQKGKKNQNQYNQKLIVKRGNEYSIPDVPLQYPVRKLKSVITDAELFSLCKSLLSIDPATRLSASDAKGHPFFQRSTFDPTKLDDTFCLQQRISSETASATTTETAMEPPNQVPNIPVDGFAEYAFIENDLDEAVDEDLITELPIQNAEGPTGDGPPLRPPPAAPKPLPQESRPVESRGTGSPVDLSQMKAALSKKEDKKALRAAAPPMRPAPSPSAAGPVQKPPKAPGKESVHASKAAVPSKQPPSLLAKPRSPQLLTKAESFDSPGGNAQHKTYISPMMGPDDMVKRMPPGESSQSNMISPMVAPSDTYNVKAKAAGWEAAEAEARFENSTSTTSNTFAPSPQPKAASSTPSKHKSQPQSNSRDSAPEFPKEEAATDSPDIRKVAGQKTARSAPSPGTPGKPQGRPFESPNGSSPSSISGILTNLTSAVKTSIASPALAPMSIDDIPSLEQDENAQHNSARAPVIPQPEIKQGGEHRDIKERGLPEGDGQNAVNWECDLSDRLARLHERLTRLRQENSVWAETSRSRRSSGRKSLEGPGSPLSHGNSGRTPE